MGLGPVCWSRSHGSQASLFFSSNSESCSPFLQLFTIPISSSLVDISDICRGLKSRASLFKTFSPPLSREGPHLSFIFTVLGNSDKNPSPLLFPVLCPLLPHQSSMSICSFPVHWSRGTRVSPFHRAIGCLKSAFSVPVSSLRCFSLPLDFQYLIFSP